MKLCTHPWLFGLVFDLCTGMVVVQATAGKSVIWNDPRWHFESHATYLPVSDSDGGVVWVVYVYVSVVPGSRPRC